VLAEGFQVGVATPEWKYLRTEGRETLYRLGDRPDETTDRAAEEPDERSAMRRRLAAELAAHPASAAARDALDDELRKTLEALGYL
jgi:hypothetical protein